MIFVSQHDCLDRMRRYSTGLFDLVFTSPPYEAQRTYDIGFGLKGEAWVEWAADRFCESHRICRGLTAWVVQGYTKRFEWSASPAMLICELKRRGVKLRNPAIYKRNGIPGSGGPDWLRSDYEWVICASHGRLPWSDNTAMGHPPKWSPGGLPSHRMANGRRVNKLHTKRGPAGTTVQGYTAPEKSNPGNVVDCVVGGGRMGSPLAHENEAPFPESLAEFFIRSFCPPGGTVFDPFCGSGTTLAVADRLGRDAVGVDIRASQVELTRRRIAHQEANTK